MLIRRRDRVETRVSGMATTVHATVRERRRVGGNRERGQRLARVVARSPRLAAERWVRTRRGETARPACAPRRPENGGGDSEVEWHLHRVARRRDLTELGLWALAGLGQARGHTTLEVSDDLGRRVAIQGRVG